MSGMTDREIVELLHLIHDKSDHPPTVEAALSALTAIERLIKERDEALEALKTALPHLGYLHHPVVVEKDAQMIAAILSKYEAKNDSN